ncbi:MAG: hypothetical protein Ct9H90mP14_1820 [Methanobacteriota archaeon]|nr:MAG: hypothetical protein Ct9H90mP14_1820 [Euryarchaeota archaeon]
MWPHVYVMSQKIWSVSRRVFWATNTMLRPEISNMHCICKCFPPMDFSAIYTNDGFKAYRYKTGIKAGMTGINNRQLGKAHLPFGGVKGREMELASQEFG